MQLKQSLSAILVTVLLAALLSPFTALSAETAPDKFTDVNAESWYYDAVTALAEIKVIEGYRDGTFGPDDPLSTAQFLKMLCGSVLPNWSEPVLSDDSAANWQDVYYYAALDRNLIRESEFDINKLDAPITRYDAALLIGRAVENVLEEDSLLQSGISGLISDNRKLPAKYVHPVQLGYSMGLFSGYEDGSFGGDNYLTRAEGAVIVMRLTAPSMRLKYPDNTPKLAIDSKTPEPSPSAAPQPPSVIPPPVQTEKPAEFVAEDTLFIGDSLTHGLYLYGKMRETNYLYSTGMSVFKALSNNFETPGGSDIKLSDALSGKKYAAVYILLGINELGSNVSDYTDAYGKIIDKIKELLPDTEVYIQSLLPVSKKRSTSGGTFTKDRINSFNESLAKLAADKEVNYVDINSLFADSEGYLPAASTWDGVHLNSKDYVTWANFLKG
ncbi:MAG: S-layer homology domain-containing protein [Oscillospiraceae bacterium]|jgi:lysophospholipase L1-like esterase|nr:S-layer homology domain-containing protein [Oscillospiraceae bacterium]